MRQTKAIFSKILVRLKTVEREEKSKGGIIMKINTEFDQQCMSYGYVISMGPYVGFRRGVPFRDIPCQVGDCVMFYKHAGTLLDNMGDGYTYRMVEDLDLEAVFPDERIEL